MSRFEFVIGLVRSSVSSAALAASRIGSALFVNKIIATQLGPAGLALVGSFQNFTAIALAFGGACIAQGLVATLSRSGSPDRRVELLRTGTTIVFAAGAVVAVAVTLFSQRLALALFGNPTLVWPLTILAVLIIPNVLNVNLWNALSGLGDRQGFVLLGLLTAAISAATIVPLSHTFGLTGALCNALVANAAPLGITAWLLGRHVARPARVFAPAIHVGALRELAAFPPMVIASLLVVPFAQLLVRNALVQNVGLAQAGYWQAVIRISDVYLVALTYLVVLFLTPRFAQATTAEIWPQCRSAAVAVGAGVGAVSVLIFLLRDSLARILFSAEFAPMTRLLPYHLAGDVVRAMGIVAGTSLAARSRTRQFVLVEIIFGAAFVASALLLLPHSGVQSAPQGYLLGAVVSTSLAVLISRRLGS